MNLTYNKAPILNPVFKALVAIAVVLFIGVLLVTWPVWIPADYALKRFGRNGFIQNAGTGYALMFDKSAFRTQL